MTNEKDLPENEPLKMIAVSGPAEAQMIEEMLKNTVSTVPFKATWFPIPGLQRAI